MAFSPAGSAFVTSNWHSVAPVPCVRPGPWAASVAPLNKCSAVRDGPLPAPLPFKTSSCFLPPCVKGPHLCRLAVLPVGYESRGPGQEELQAGEAEQGQL